MTKKLSGVLVPVATPFINDELDLEAFKKIIIGLNKTGLAGYLVLGSNGEAVYLSDGEKEKLIQAAREATPDEKILMIGAGAESTREAIGLCGMASGLGADCVMVLPPHYYTGQMTDERLTGHYHKLADSASIPVLVYNMPASTGINMDEALVSELSLHPNIVGVKDSSGNMNQLSEIIRLTAPDFAVFVGSSPQLFPALCLGADGGILAVANVTPRVCCMIEKAYKDGDFTAALNLHQLLSPLAAMVTSRWGVPALKAAMEMAGLPGGEVRSPLTDLDDPEIKAALEYQLEILAPYEEKKINNSAAGHGVLTGKI